MRTTNTFGIQFIARMNKMKNNQAPIYIRITVDARRIEILLKRWIDPNDWNNEKGLARGSREEVKSLNHFLEEVKARLIECYQDLQIQKQLITAETIKNKFLGSDQKEYSLSKLMEYHNTNMKNSLAWSTLKNYFTTQKYVGLFLKNRLSRNYYRLKESKKYWLIEC